MKYGRLARLLIVLNCLSTGFVLYFLYRGFYHREESIFRGEPSSFEINPVFKFLIVAGIVVPFLTFITTRQYRWLLQVILTVMVTIFWKEDFLQKTLFINQPTSKARAHAHIRRLVDKNGDEISKSLESIKASCLEVVSNDERLTTIRDMTGHPYSKALLMDRTDTNHVAQTTHGYVVAYLSSPPLIKSEAYKIENIVLEKGEIIRLDIIFTNAGNTPTSYLVSYWPNGVKKIGLERAPSALHQLNTEIYLEREMTFVYKSKWTVAMYGPFMLG